jgi:hypothetical protein
MNLGMAIAMRIAATPSVAISSINVNPPGLEEKIHDNFIDSPIRSDFELKACQGFGRWFFGKSAVEVSGSLTNPRDYSGTKTSGTST